MAFTSFDASRTQLYVTGVPVAAPPKLADMDVLAPRWSADGKYVYYAGGNRHVMRLAVSTVPTLTVGTPEPLFELKPSTMLVDVARDGRFLLVELKVRSNQRPLTMVTDAFGPARR
jgi:hypothetical protein